MDVLLLVLRAVLGLISPAWRDSLLMAARADGRVEHHLPRPGLRERWRVARSRREGRRNRPALAVRAPGECPPRDPVTN